MSVRDGQPVAGSGPEDEDFLGRWSRRKAEARSGTVEHDEEAPGAAIAHAADLDAPAAGSPDPAAAVPLPDLDTLGEDSDYSAFLAQGVDATLRRTALRKLFQSPKFNVLDGLDDYMGDFTSFEPLGSLVTADMRFRLEHAAKRLAEALDTPAAPDVAAARTPATPPPVAVDPDDDTISGATPDDGKTTPA